MIKYIVLVLVSALAVSCSSKPKQEPVAPPAFDQAAIDQAAQEAAEAEAAEKALAKKKAAAKKRKRAAAYPTK